MAELENCDLNDELENTHENFESETHELSITGMATHFCIRPVKATVSH